MNTVHHTRGLVVSCLVIQNGIRGNWFVGGDIIADEGQLKMLYLDVADAIDGRMHKD
jgi:hypothetical protein